MHTLRKNIHTLMYSIHSSLNSESKTLIALTNLTTRNVNFFNKLVLNLCMTSYISNSYLFKFKLRTWFCIVNYNDYGVSLITLIQYYV